MTQFPAIESEASIEPQALRPPYFPSSPPLADPRHYAGGIPIRALEGNLQCIIPPWNIMEIGDRVDVTWQSLTSPAVSKTIEFDHEVDQQVVLWIPRGQVLEGDATPVFYRVTRRNQTAEPSVPLQTYLVKTTRPGGYDDSPEEGHSGFQYTFLTDISGGVDADMANRGVQMRIEPYQHMTAYDHIVCRWGSQEVMHYPVTQAQIDDPVNNPIIITFTRAVIEAAGDGDRVVVTFQVIDCVDNRPDERAPWAKLSYVLVDLGGNRLRAPLVLMEGRPTNSIDLDQLGDDHVNVRVYTPIADFAVGDTVRLTWTGTPAQGSPIIVGPLEQTVDFVDFQLDFTIPNAAVKAIAQGYATVSYVRIRSGEADRPSKNASVSVRGDINRLPAPSVAQAPGGTLPADAPYATISVAYFEGRKTGDLITIHCQGRRPGGSETYYPIPIIVADSDGRSAITRDLPGSEIAPLGGGTLKLYYVVANDDLTVRSERESLPLNLNVGVALPDFNRPEITEADGDVLLPENTPNGANVSAPFNVPGDTLPGDTVGLRWTGSVTGAHPLYEIPLTTQTAGKPVPFLVRAEHIHPNLNGTVEVDYYRKRGTEATRFSRKRVLSVGSALPDWAAPTIKEASGGTLDPMRATLTLTVQVPGTLQSDDLLSVTWSGAAGAGSYTSVAKPVREIGQNIEIPVSLIAYNLGRAVTVSYAVSRGGAPAKSSLPLVQNVQRIPDEHPDFPTPRISRASGNELDVTQLVGTDTLLIDRWRFPAIGQCVWLTLSCPGADGTDVPFVIWTGQAHNQEPGITLALSAYLDWLKGRQDGATVSITFKVNLDKVANEATAVKFPVRTYTVKAQPEERLTFDNGPYLIAPAGRLKNIHLKLCTEASNLPVPDATIILTLSAGFSYADDGTGAREFKTDSAGNIIIIGIKGSTISGTHMFTATRATHTVQTAVVVTKLGPARSITVGRPTIWIEMTPDGTQAYVTCEGSASILVIDTATQSIVRTIEMNSRPAVVAIASDGIYAYVGVYDSTSISKIDLEAQRVIAIGEIDKNKHSHGIVFSEDLKFAYIACYGSSAIVEIDTTTLVVLRRLSVGNGPSHMVLSSRDNRIYVSNSFSNSISVIDRLNMRLIKTIPVSGAPYGIAIQPDGTRVFVCSSALQTVTIINTASLTVERTVTVGPGPYGIIFSHDGKRVYICNRHATTISVVDVESLDVIRTINVEKNPITMALSSDDALLYVCHFGANNIRVIEV